MKVCSGSCYNYYVFANSTLDFWNGNSPYTQDFFFENGREFLYSPIFSVLFIPFALFPLHVGVYLWNVFNFVVFFVTIMTLPERMFPYRVRCWLLLYLLLLLVSNLHCFQYNILVTCFFVQAWTALENRHDFLAVLLILISGFTKVYGIFELALLLCYPKRFWKNILYVTSISAVLFILPLLKLQISELIPYYHEWIQALDIHQSSKIYDSFFFAKPIAPYILPHFRTVQIITLSLLGVLFVVRKSRWCDWRFRVQALGIMMGWVVLMSDSAELVTYLIAMTGVGLWYWSRNQHTTLDKILIAALFVVFCIIPIDIFCPSFIMRYITRVLWIDIYLFTFVWLRMIYLTVSESYTLNKQGQMPIAMETGNHSDGRIDLVLPCYNPHSGFIPILKESVLHLRTLFPERGFHVIISNDGSDRGFDSGVRSELIDTIDDCEIVDNPHKGKGSAVRGGIAISRAPYVIYSDIDLPYEIESMVLLVEELLRGSDLVIAVRNESYYQQLSFKRRLLSKLSKGLNRLLLCSAHPDTQGGLKGLSSSARDIMLETTVDGFLFDAQFVRMCVNRSLNVTDIEASLKENVKMSNFRPRIVLIELKNFIRILLGC